MRMKKLKLIAMVLVMIMWTLIMTTMIMIIMLMIKRMSNIQPKLVFLLCPLQVLFELARFHAPSTIFLDELESLMSQRGTGGGG